jgi:ATP-dependent Clp protease ATP-binding subunit ClpA
MPLISKELESTLSSALGEAHMRRHEYLCAEHVLYAVLGDSYGQTVLKHCGANLDRLRQKIETFLTQELEPVPAEQKLDVQQTVAFERLMERALSHVYSAGKEEADCGDILAAIFEEEDSHAAWFLESEGVTRLDILNYISHGIGKVDLDGSDGASLNREMFDNDEESDPSSHRNPLEAFTENLMEKAELGKIDPLIGRDNEIRRAVRILCRRRKNNPIFVGEPGVGKTALAEGLAQRIHDGQVPKILSDKVLLRLDLAALLAGTRFRGDFEARMKSLMKALKEHDHYILFIDEIHTVVGAGTTRGSEMDASTMLKPALSNGELRCIGATTYEEFKKGFEKDRALSRRFQKIDVPEPSVEETIRILKGLKERYESYHGITYTPAAIRTAAELSAKYINDRFLPDKAIDVLDEAAANIHVSTGVKRKTIRPLDIEHIVAEIARVPARSVSSDDKEKLRTLESDLKLRIFGQDSAIESIATSIKRSRAGLGQAEKPVGSFLFTGPTGVGKTELAKQLASNLGIEFIRFDMSEYMEPHAVSRLIGSPPGYVGHEEGGQLTETVRNNPHAVLLLDEMEKAHPDIYNILLQIMDHATLTDNQGRTADFRNIILIMTSNAGARELEANAIGFSSEESDQKHRSKKAIERVFTPEFRNRLDAIVYFDSLPLEVVLNIVDKFITRLREKLQSRKVKLQLTDGARTWLAEHGYDAKLGARPLGRLIQNDIETRLSDELLFGKLEKGGNVEIGVENDAITFTFL